jgi:hypothetical protein
LTTESTEGTEAGKKRVFGFMIRETFLSSSVSALSVLSVVNNPEIPQSR